MTARRRWLLLTPLLALALLLAWHAWPPARAARDATTSRRAAATSRLAARQPAPVQQPAPPAAPAPTAAKTGIPACDRFIERTMTCAQLPADARIAIAEASKAWAELTAAGPQPDLEASCRATAAVQGEALTAMGC